MEEFREFALDTAYRCGWTFTQAFLSCMTFGQSIMDIDWKQSIFISLGAVVYVLLKQIGKWCKDHIKDSGDLPEQFTFNMDSFVEMMDSAIEPMEAEDEDTNGMSEEE